MIRRSKSEMFVWVHSMLQNYFNLKRNMSCCGRNFSRERWTELKVKSQVQETSLGWYFTAKKELFSTLKWKSYTRGDITRAYWGHHKDCGEKSVYFGRLHSALQVAWFVTFSFKTTCVCFHFWNIFSFKTTVTAVFIRIIQSSWVLQQ